MERLVLIGDSIIDNGPYVAAGEPDVAAQIRKRLGVAVEMRAVDGYTVADVAADLDRSPLSPGVPVVLSAGGNDALGHMDALQDPAPMPFAEALSRVHALRAAFAEGYGALLDRLIGRPVLVFAIYNPRFAGVEGRLQLPAEAGLSVFNDVILSEAMARGFTALDLRRVFTSPDDYANPIEPSSQGGHKIAEEVAAWFDRAASRDGAA